MNEEHAAPIVSSIEIAGVIASRIEGGTPPVAGSRAVTTLKVGCWTMTGSGDWVSRSVRYPDRLGKDRKQRDPADPGREQLTTADAGQAQHPASNRDRIAAIQPGFGRRDSNRDAT